MNQIAIRTEPQPKLMLLAYMADKYSLSEVEFSKTVRATCGLATATPEQFAAFLIVAKEYSLNPLTKEIYAFPSRGGGIVPIVSIDGWVNLVNSHGACDGFEFEMAHDDQGALVSCTCRMYRKDRKHPVTVTEYLVECIRATEPWKMQHRMLRHKSMIQAARYAFGFSGVYDEDEGRTIAEAVDVTPRPRVPSPSEIIETPRQDPALERIERDNDAEVAAAEATKGDPITSGVPPKAKRDGVPDIETEYDGWFSWALYAVTKATDGGALESFWNAEIEIYHGKPELLDPDYQELCDAYTAVQAKLNSDE